MECRLLEAYLRRDFINECSMEGGQEEEGDTGKAGPPCSLKMPSAGPMGSSEDEMAIHSYSKLGKEVRSL